MRIGVVGAGYWGTKVLREYVALRDAGHVEEVLVCDRSPTALARAKRMGRLDATAATLAPMLRRVDAVHVATGNDLHAAVAGRCLAAGVHVLLEKPMTTSAASAYRLAEQAAAHGLVLQAGHIYRFNHAVRRVAALAKKGHFGRIYYYKLQWTTKMPSPAGLDILWDLLPHPLDILHFIEGEWPQGFVGTARSYRRRSPPEVAFLQASYPKDRVASIELSWLRPLRRRRLEVVGSKRDAILDCVEQELDLVEDGRVRRQRIQPNNTIRDELLHFLDSVQHRRNPLNSAIVGARNVEAVETAIRTLE